jgi:hypothetical protein
VGRKSWLCQCQHTHFSLGIGACTAIFSVVDAVLLRALPYPNPEKIVRVWERAADGHHMNLADPNFEDFLSQNNTFAHLAVYGYGLTSVSGGTEPVRVNVAEVSSGFFQALGVGPFRGRAFAAEEQRLHGTPAVIVSYGFWRQHLGSASDLSKLHLRIEGAVAPVVGVMPEGFDFPAEIAAWIPRQSDPVISRIVGDVKTALLTLLGAVVLLLMVACANVAGLLLARTSARRKELAVCAALDAGRGRLIQQFLAESFTLSLTGGGLGILLAMCAVRVLPAILPANLPRQQGIAIDAPVLLFALATSIAVAVSLGLFAAWRAAAGDPQEALTAAVTAARARASAFAEPDFSAAASYG